VSAELKDAIVVGGGPAGLAIAAALKQDGLAPLLLEAGSALGYGWSLRYDRLHLHTPRILSGLPGYGIPRRYGRWLARDDVVEYLKEYAAHFGLDVRLETRAERIERAGDGWSLQTSSGLLEARQVVLATGFLTEPRLPSWPGVESFEGELVHSGSYRRPDPYRGRDVLVVGSGNSGAEIAQDLAENGAARVRIAIRTPPQIAKRSSLGIPTHFVGIALGKLPPRVGGQITKTLRRLTIPDLSAQGLPRPTETLAAQFGRTGTIPILDVGFVRQVREGRIEVVAAVERLDGADVVLADGSRIQPDVVVTAIGFRPGIEPLVGHLGVLDERGLPISDEPEPGLYLFGYSATLGGTIRLLAQETPHLARRIAARHRDAQTPESATARLATSR
jgi:putative flavoprotein involved in K+ transport